MTESVPKSSAMGSSSIAMLLCGVGLDRSDREVARLMNEQKEMATSMGQMLGEEVLHTMRIANDPQTDIRLLGRHTTVTVDGEGPACSRDAPRPLGTSPPDQSTVDQAIAT